MPRRAGGFDCFIKVIENKNCGGKKFGLRVNSTRPLFLSPGSLGAPFSAHPYAELGSRGKREAAAGVLSAGASLPRLRLPTPGRKVGRHPGPSPRGPVSHWLRATDHRGEPTRTWHTGVVLGEAQGPPFQKARAQFLLLRFHLQENRIRIFHCNLWFFFLSKTKAGEILKS